MPKPAPPRNVRGTARVAFLAHRDTIVAELTQGYTAQAIYDRHQARLGASISYPQFARYVRRLRDHGTVPPLWGSPVSPAASPPVAAAVPLSAPKPEPVGSAAAQLEPGARTFRHSPTPARARWSDCSARASSNLVADRQGSLLRPLPSQ